jgi:hypothetical protein
MLKRFFLGLVFCHAFPVLAQEIRSWVRLTFASTLRLRWYAAID